MPRSREQYLDALGIEQWLPREAFPGVPVGRLARLKSDGDDASGDVPVRAPAAVTGTGANPPTAETASSLAARIRQELKPTAVPSPIALSPAAPSPAAPGAPTLKAPARATDKQPSPAIGSVLADAKFQLQLYHWVDSILVIDEAAGNAAENQSGSEAKLLAAILQAMGYQANIARKATSFAWPQPRQVDAVPAELLAGLLHRELSAGNIRTLLVLGDVSQRLLAETGQVEANPGLQLVNTHSLAAMLRHPALKAEVWRAVQPICAAASKA